MTVDCCLKVDGVPLAASGMTYSDLTWTDRADGGNFELSWSMELQFGERPAPLFSGALVEVLIGPMRRWRGLLADLDWDGGTFTANGMSRYGDGFLALDSLGQKSSVPDTIIDAAAAAGWQVGRLGSFGSGPVLSTDADASSPGSVNSVLDAYTATQGQYWGVWADGVVRRYAAPSVPTLYLAPGAIELGETTEETYSTLVFQYIDSATSQVARIGRTNGSLPVQQFLYDATDKPPMTAVAAGVFADNLIALGRGSQGWTSSAEVASAQLLGPNGLPVELANVTAGTLMRAQVPGEYGVTYRDLVLGEVKYAAGSDVTSLSPTEKAATSLSEVFEDTYARLTGTPVAA